MPQELWEHPPKTLERRSFKYYNEKNCWRCYLQVAVTICEQFFSFLVTKWANTITLIPLKSTKTVSQSYLSFPLFA
jgi:hypothetical protein